MPFVELVPTWTGRGLSGDLRRETTKFGALTTHV